MATCERAYGATERGTDDLTMTHRKPPSCGHESTPAYGRRLAVFVPSIP